MKGVRHIQPDDSYFDMVSIKVCLCLLVWIWCGGE